MIRVKCLSCNKTKRYRVNRKTCRKCDGSGFNRPNRRIIKPKKIINQPTFEMSGIKKRKK